MKALLRTSGTESSELLINGIVFPYSYTEYDLTKISRNTSLDIYYFLELGKLEVSSESQTTKSQIFEYGKSIKPSTEIILTSDPYDYTGNRTFVSSSLDNNIGNDGDVLIHTGRYIYRKENQVWTLKIDLNYSTNLVPSVWHFSQTVNDQIGANGDFLLREDGKVYYKEGGHYTYKTSIRGNDGVGVDGEPGNKIYTCSDVSLLTGNLRENDIAIENADILYTRTNNEWVNVGSVKGKGVKGDQGLTGRTPVFRTTTSAVDNSIGLDGDILLNVNDYKIYTKEAGVYTYSNTLSTPEGTIIRNIQVDDSIGKDGDFILREDGTFFKRVNGHYVDQLRITGQSIYFTEPQTPNTGDIVINENYKLLSYDGTSYVEKLSLEKKTSTSIFVLDYDFNSDNLSSVTSYSMVINENQATISNSEIVLSAGRYSIELNLLADTKYTTIQVMNDTVEIANISSMSNLLQIPLEISSDSQIKIKVNVNSNGNIIRSGNIFLKINRLISTNSNYNVSLKSNNSYDKYIRHNITISTSSYSITTDNNYTLKEKYNTIINSNTLISLGNSSTNGKKLSLKVTSNSNNIVFDTANIDLGTYSVTDLNTLYGISLVIFVYDTTLGKWKLTTLVKGI